MKHTNEDERVAWLQKKAYTIRRDILLALGEAGSGHTGGSLGLTDLFTVLYFHQLRYKADDPSWSERDRLILSIGHVAPVLYATLAHAGFFDVEELMTLRKMGSRLQGHPDRNHGLPGLELSSGSLGQGLSVGVGMALASRLKRQQHKVVVICGDGELQEGSVWEAAMSGAHYSLDNLIVIIDRNYLQIDGQTSDVMDIEPLDRKWEAFGWRVVTGDGNSITDLTARLEEVWQHDGRPTCFIARTTMGRGLPSIENNHAWHGRAPSKQELINFLNELY
jgi:transketolase